MRSFEATLSEVDAGVRAFRRQRVCAHTTDAPNFNVFDFLRTDELGLSGFLRWMLDADGSHEQGAEFLSLFCTVFGISHQFDHSCAKSRVEVGIEAMRRLDVKVTCGDYGLAIENKPYAGWQSNQIRDYLKHLKVAHGTTHCLVLLKGRRGNAPADQLTDAERTTFIQAGHLVDSDYDVLHNWIVACADRSTSARVATALRDFARYIDENFAGGGKMEEAADIARNLASDPKHVAAAVMIIDARRALFELLTERLREAIHERASERGWSAFHGIPKGVSFNPGKRPILIDDGKSDLQVVFDINEDLERDLPYVGLVGNTRHRGELQNDYESCYGAACPATTESAVATGLGTRT